MSGFLYGVALQWKLDIRSKSLLVTCYIVPLIFFLLMGGVEGNGNGTEPAVYPSCRL